MDYEELIVDKSVCKMVDVIIDLHERIGILERLICDLQDKTNNLMFISEVENG